MIPHRRFRRTEPSLEATALQETLLKAGDRGRDASGLFPRRQTHRLHRQSRCSGARAPGPTARAMCRGAAEGNGLFQRRLVVVALMVARLEMDRPAGPAERLSGQRVAVAPAEGGRPPCASPRRGRSTREPRNGAPNDGALLIWSQYADAHCMLASGGAWGGGRRRRPDFAQGARRSSDRKCVNPVVTDATTTPATSRLTGDRARMPRTAQAKRCQNRRNLAIARCSPSSQNRDRGSPK